MQRDFVLPGGFGEALGNDTSLLLAAVEPIPARARTLPATSACSSIHTREGHRPDLTDCPSAKLDRGGKTFIASGPMGRILVRGEPGHDIIEALTRSRASR